MTDENKSPAAPTAKPRNTLFYVLFALDIATLVPWLFVTFASFFAFDAPGSDENVTIWCFVLSIWFYPLFNLACMATAFVLNHKGRTRGGRIAMALPLVGCALFVAAIGVAFIREND